MEILVTQLNSYKQGKPIDALLLELNFTFEIAYSSRYIVDNKSIRMDQYAINGLQCSEDGDIIGTKEVPDSTVRAPRLSHQRRAIHAGICAANKMSAQ